MLASSTAMNILVSPSFCECAGGSVTLITKWIKVVFLKAREVEHKLRGTSNPLNLCAESCICCVVFQGEGPLLCQILTEVSDLTKV